MFELKICDHIAAAHFLRNYTGKCANMHGHTWRIEATIIGDSLDKVGMIVDFTILKNKLKDLVNELDHVCLNELEYFKKINPTSENIAKFIFNKLSSELSNCDPPCKLKKVTVWESPITCASYYN